MTNPDGFDANGLSKEEWILLPKYGLRAKEKTPEWYLLNQLHRGLTVGRRNFKITRHNDFNRFYGLKSVVEQKDADIHILDSVCCSGAKLVKVSYAAWGLLCSADGPFRLEESGGYIELLEVSSTP